MNPRIAVSSSEALSSSQSTIGPTCRIKGNDAFALRFYFDALKGYESAKNKEKMTLAYLAIGHTYKRMEDYKMSIDFLSRGLRLKESMEDKDIIYYGTLIHQANAAKELKDYEMCFTSSRKSLAYFKDDPSIRVMVETNMGFYFNELYKEPKVDSLITRLKIEKKRQLLDSSLFIYNKALKTAEALKNESSKSYAYFGLGENAYLNKNYSKAIQYYKRSNAITQKLNNNNSDLLKRCYNGIYLSFLELGDYKNALINYQSFIEQEKKIQSEENKRGLIEQNLVYEHEKELQKSEEELRRKEDQIKEQNRLIVIGILSFIGILIIVLLLIKRKQLLNEKKLQRQFSQDLLITQEKERKRISEDLHDGFGQNLLLIKNQLTLKNYNQSKDYLNKAIEEVRTIASTLYPFHLNRVGISKSVENLIIQLADNYKNIDFLHEIDDMKGLLTDIQEMNVFRIIQECLSNVIKHANADSVKVSLQTEEDKVQIKIQDNGKGFDFFKKNKEQKTLGLRTIEERTDFLKGNLKIDSIKGSGTSFHVVFPLTT